MIEGVDISKWQGALTDEIVLTMKAQGVRFAYVKASQGAASQDPQFANNVGCLQRGGVLVGAYHFVTNDDANNQYANFVSTMGGFAWDLPPALDCEAFQEASREVRSVRDTAYGLSYPSQAIVGSMAAKLAIWMSGQASLNAFTQPAIYTNCASGNRIFTQSAFSKYPLWVANWGATSPCIPAMWKGKAYYIWQDYVIKDASDYGLINTALDHDQWGSLYPFPEDEPEPPPPGDTIEVTIKQDGKIYQGTLEAV